MVASNVVSDVVECNLSEISKKKSRKANRRWSQVQTVHGDLQRNSFERRHR